MSTPLIPADAHWFLWAVLLGAAAFGYAAERTSWGRRVSGVVLTMGATFLLSNLGVIPSEGAAAYDLTWSYLVPLAIPLLLFGTDIRGWLRYGGKAVGSFALAVIAVCTSSFVGA
ncbi:DUF819 family protein, partial [bacterium]|nr:DUF819 family protein [bacterium]